MLYIDEGRMTTVLLDLCFAPDTVDHSLLLRVSSTGFGFLVLYSDCLSAFLSLHTELLNLNGKCE